MISLDLESEFDAEEFECGGDGVGVAVGGGCNMVVEEVEMDNGYCSTVAGSDGVWKITGPVPWSPDRLLRRRYQRNTPTRTRRIPAHAPTTIPPMAPPFNL